MAMINPFALAANDARRAKVRTADKYRDGGIRTRYLTADSIRSVSV